MAESIEDADESTCSVCLDVFKTPKVLSCGHSFCQEPCLRDLASTSRHRKFNCPLCRTKISLPKSRNAKDFPTNFSLQSLLESKKRKRSVSKDSAADRDKKRATAPPVPQCTHLLQAEFYCEKCQRFLCLDCVTDYHSDELHSIIAKDTALEQARQHSERMVKETLAGLKQSLAVIRGQLEDADRAYLSYDLLVDQLKKDVRASMEHARKVTAEKERHFIDVICKQAEVDKTTFQTFQRKWGDRKLSYEQMLNPLEGILLKVQAGDLTSMDQVMNVGPIEASCSAMVKENKLLPFGPPFGVTNELPDKLPRLQRICSERT